MPKAERLLVVSKRLFQPDAALVSELQNYRQAHLVDDVMRNYDAVLLDPGLGPAVYLSLDGRIVWDDDGWGVTATRGEALAAILAGVMKTRIVALLRLLPSRPTGALDCSQCGATGRFDFNGQLQNIHGERSSVVCMTCCGLGWIAPSVDLKESVLESTT
ncbi:MAG: hypothetical protein QM756_20975 [Polyangiaceae bacterium]